MSYEIIGETIKSATSIKLGDIFKVATNQTDAQGNTVYTYPKRYKENVSHPTYPNFHIIQVNLIETPMGLTQRSLNSSRPDRIQLDYLINVQYRVAENTETITNLQQQLDAVGLKLNAEFNELNLELPTKVTNKNYEKVDGVGQFTFNVRVFATPQLANEIQMNKLNENINIKE